MDVLPKFVRAYNDMVHSRTGMAHSQVTDSGVLAIWKKIEGKRRRVRMAKVKFNVGQHVRISKKKMMFAKGGEQNFSIVLFRMAKVIERHPRTVYELEDLNDTHIWGQFYQEELTSARVSKRIDSKIDKILDKRFRRGIRE